MSGYLQTKTTILELLKSSILDGIITAEEIHKATTEAVNLQLMWMGGHPHTHMGVPPRKRKKMNDSDPRYTGQLSKYNPKSGYGFISSKDTQTLYPDCDVFLHRNQFEDLNLRYPGIRPGVWVEFGVELKNGKPQARDIEVIPNQS